MSLANAMIVRVPGQAPEPPHRGNLQGQGPVAFPTRVVPPFAQDVGPDPNTHPHPWVKRFIPPLSLFNDATRWVNILSFVKPMTFNMTSGFPPLRSQYFTPPPIDDVKNLAAGQRNLQKQLGNLNIQGARLDAQASNYFGS